jgi:hypothetical protein
MPKSVIDGFEVIQVEIGHGDRALAPAAKREQMMTLLVKSSTVQQRAQWVGPAQGTLS